MYDYEKDKENKLTDDNDRCINFKFWIKAKNDLSAKTIFCIVTAAIILFGIVPWGIGIVNILTWIF